VALMAGWFRSRSFQARLSLLVAVAVGVAVALASIAAYFAVSRQLYGGVNSTLQDDLSRCTHNGGLNTDCLVAVVRASGLVGIFDAQGQDVTPLFVNGSDRALLDGSQAISPTRGQLALAAGGGGGRATTTDQTYSGGPYRVLAVPVNVGGGLPTGPSVVLLIAQPLHPTIATLAHLRVMLLLVVALGVAVAVALGMAVARATIRPVKRLTAAAEHVTATQSLDAAIEERGDDELARLARAFNEMLAGLQASREQQVQLVSDAGHELRTPLTSLRTNIELLMRARELPAADRDELLADVQGQLQEMTDLVGDIVETARQDEQHLREYGEVRFDEVVARAVERARRRAPSLRFELRTTPGLVRAQPALLERAVLNVVDNAAKWSPPGGTVEVLLERAGVWQLSIRDQGPGIAAEDLPRVFDRFYRAPSARSMPGSGLGLAIVSQVVADLGGKVTAESPPAGGTVVRLELPVVDEQEPAPDGGGGGWAAVPPPPPAWSGPRHAAGG
jgi:two-component system sensor histidine kinase MprB